MMWVVREGMVAGKKKDCEGCGGDRSEEGSFVNGGERGTTAGVYFLRERLADYPGMVSASSMHSS